MNSENELDGASDEDMSTKEVESKENNLLINNE
jgi:hypothetical protein